MPTLSIERRDIAPQHILFVRLRVARHELSSAIGEERGTIEEVYEPYLIQIGFLDRTPRGRTVTRLARRHLRSSSEAPPQRPLFQE